MKVSTTSNFFSSYLTLVIGWYFCFLYRLASPLLPLSFSLTTSFLALDSLHGGGIIIIPLSSLVSQLSFQFSTHCPPDPASLEDFSSICSTYAILLFPSLQKLDFTKEEKADNLCLIFFGCSQVHPYLPHDLCYSSCSLANWWRQSQGDFEQGPGKKHRWYNMDLFLFGVLGCRLQY